MLPRTCAVLLLALLTVGSIAATPAAARTSGTFADDNRSVHEESIEALHQARITDGCGIGEFCPREVVTRGQLAKFLARAFRPGPASRDWFVDDGASPFEAAINRIREHGWTSGCNPPRNDRYCPTGALTRAQLAKLLGAALALPPSTRDHFVDDDGHVLEASVDAFAAAGITAGCNPPANDRFCPDDPVTRAQVATFFARALDLTTSSPSDVTHPVALEGYGLSLRLPSAASQLIGQHQSSHDGARDLTVVPGTVDSVLLASRGRGTGRRSAQDIVMHPAVEVRAPVTGRVLRAGTYRLYCSYSDDYLVIEPDGRPGFEVKLLHIDGVMVDAGDRVVAGVTVVAPRPTVLPFESQVDDHSGTRWPHVHLEVVDTSIPDRPSGGC